MRRRTLLTQLAGAGAAAALAGCIADRPGTEGDDPDAESEEQPAGNESSGDADNQSADSTGSGMSSPELTGTDVETRGTAEEASDDAAISFGDGTVTVEGTISAPSPCYEAAVKDAAYSEADDEFRVTVTTRQVETDRMCSQVISGVKYALNASFDGGTPINVAVTHETAADGTTTVAEDSRQ